MILAGGESKLGEQVRGGSLGGGTLSLALTGFANRAVGFIYGAFLMRVAGAEAVGLYKLVTPLYITILTLATFGIPYAVALLVSEMLGAGNRKAALLYFRMARRIVALSSTVSAVILFLLADPIARMFWGDPRGAAVARVLAPCLVTCALVEVTRGYFEGRRFMGLVGVSQLLEQVGHAVVTIGLIAYLPELGEVRHAQFMAFGIIAGEVASGLFLVVLFLSDRHRLLGRRRLVLQAKSSCESSMMRMFRFALPVAVGRVIASAALTYNISLIVLRLQVYGLDKTEATRQLGMLTGVALPLVFIPNIINFALARNLVPALAAAAGAGNDRAITRITVTSLYTTVLTGLPAAAFLVYFARPICDCLYATPEAARMTAVIALAGPLAYLRQTTQGVLQGLGLPEVHLQNYIIALAVDTFVVYTAGAALGPLGIALASCVNFLAGALLNVVSVWRRVRIRFDLIQGFAIPVVASVLCTQVAAFAYVLLQRYLRFPSTVLLEALSLSGAMLVAACLYCLVVAHTGPGRMLLHRVLALLGIRR